jgi:hypothetical protein
VFRMRPEGHSVERVQPRAAAKDFDSPAPTVHARYAYVVAEEVE